MRQLQQQKEIDVVKGPNGTMAYPLQKGNDFGTKRNPRKVPAEEMRD